MSSLSFRHSPSHKYKKIGEKEVDVSMLQAAQGVKASLRALASIFFQFFCFGLHWKEGGVLIVLQQEATTDIFLTCLGRMLV